MGKEEREKGVEEAETAVSQPVMLLVGMSEQTPWQQQQPSEVGLPPKPMPVPTSPPPGEQTKLALVPTSPPPPPPPPSSPSVGGGGASSNQESSSLPDPKSDPHPDNPNPNPIPDQPSSSSSTAITKIPFRPRKIRKVSSSSADGQNPDDKPNPSGGSRLVLRVPSRPLTLEDEIAAALRHLRTSDPFLAGVIDVHEPPTFQSIHPPFHSLTRSILYQQLAFKAAASIYSRFIALCGGEAGVLPEAVLSLTPHQLRQIGVSARKASYLHDLANKYRSGILSDESIVGMDDKSLSAMLTMVKGIGTWSVHMFMIFSLHRPDVLPVSDLGVRKGVQILYNLDSIPRPSQMEQLCERWKPYRSVGSWYMWRLSEAKAPPTMASTSGEAGGGSGLAGFQHQPQLVDPIQIDPIQRIPNLG